MTLSYDSQETIENNTLHNMVMNADKAKLNQVMRNMLSNALKFTPSGGTVDVNACLFNRSAYDIASKENQWIRICVTDSGPGISKVSISVCMYEF